MPKVIGSQYLSACKEKSLTIKKSYSYPSMFDILFLAEIKALVSLADGRGREAPSTGWS